MAVSGGGWGCLPGGGARGVLPRRVSARGWECLPRGVSARGYTPLWTEFLTHTCENITFPQMLRTVKITNRAGYAGFLQMKKKDIATNQTNLLCKPVENIFTRFLPKSKHDRLENNQPFCYFYLFSPVKRLKIIDLLHGI